MKYSVLQILHFFPPEATSYFALNPKSLDLGIPNSKSKLLMYEKNRKITSLVTAANRTKCSAILCFFPLPKATACPALNPQSLDLDILKPKSFFHGKKTCSNGVLCSIAGGSGFGGHRE